MYKVSSLLGKKKYCTTNVLDGMRGRCLPFTIVRCSLLVKQRLTLGGIELVAVLEPPFLIDIFTVLAPLALQTGSAAANGTVDLVDEEFEDFRYFDRAVACPCPAFPRVLALHRHQNHMGARLSKA